MRHAALHSRECPKDPEDPEDPKDLTDPTDPIEDPKDPTDPTDSITHIHTHTSHAHLMHIPPCDACLSLSLDAEATLGSGEHRDGAGVDTCSIPKRLHPRIAYVSPMLMFSPHAFPPCFPIPPRENLKTSGRLAQSRGGTSRHPEGLLKASGRHAWHGTLNSVGATR